MISQPNATGGNGKAAQRTHPSQLPIASSVRRRPALMLRAPPAMIAALDKLAKKRGISRNSLLVEMIETIIAGGK